MIKKNLKIFPLGILPACVVLTGCLSVVTVDVRSARRSRLYWRSDSSVRVTWRVESPSEPHNNTATTTTTTTLTTDNSNTTTHNNYYDNSLN